MAELNSISAMEAYDEVMLCSDDDDFKSKLDLLISVVQDDVEFALMHGKNRHLGPKHMLTSALYNAISLTNRPVHREAAFAEVNAALDKYLGIKPLKKKRKRKRRGLLTHV